jgi:hypothetical protein
MDLLELMSLELRIGIRFSGDQELKSTEQIVVQHEEVVNVQRGELSRSEPAVWMNGFDPILVEFLVVLVECEGQYDAALCDLRGARDAPKL